MSKAPRGIGKKLVWLNLKLVRSEGLEPPTI
ncbi:MAG: hypothetical protein RLZZ350_1419 [Verrucomicrobiota bacterium]